MELNRIGFCILLLIIGKLKFIATAEWKCSEDVCSEFWTTNPSCPTISSDCRNASKAIILPTSSICNCCEELCIKFLEKGEDCLVGKPGQTFQNDMCGPNLYCSSVTETCEEMNHPSGYDPDFFPGYTCDKDDICKCAVIDGEEVKNIFGEFKKTKDTENEKQCECSIAAYKAQTQPYKAFPFRDTYMPTSRCLKNGQYDPLQCLSNTCYCVSKETGEWDKTIPIVSPIFTIKVDNPPCFDPDLHKPGEYFTECELERSAMLDDKRTAEAEGFKVLYSQTINCKPDGTYADVKL